MAVIALATAVARAAEIFTEAQTRELVEKENRGSPSQATGDRSVAVENRSRYGRRIGLEGELQRGQRLDRKLKL